MRFTDQNDNPLKVDGEVGSITWARLFGLEAVSQSSHAERPFLNKVLKIAKSQIGKMEHPSGSNPRARDR